MTITFIASQYLVGIQFYFFLLEINKVKIPLTDGVTHLTTPLSSSSKALQYKSRGDNTTPSSCLNYSSVPQVQHERTRSALPRKNHLAVPTLYGQFSDLDYNTSQVTFCGCNYDLI